MPVHESVVQTVTETNYKNLGEMGALTAAIASQNLVGHMRAMDGVRELVMMEGQAQRAGADIAESIAQGVTARSTTPEMVALLGGIVAALQQITKSAQTTPPVTP
ncbi:MAG: hypothetical protein ACYSUB_20735 [Planctomycetota bacterium]|jgi:hypothetical protein